MNSTVENPLRASPCPAGDAHTSLTRAERIILQNASLLPENGMEATLFLSCQEEEYASAAEDLLRRELLTARGGILLPTPLPYSGHDRDYGAFLDALSRRAKEGHFPSPEHYGQICQCFKRAAFFLEDQEGTLAQTAGALFERNRDLAEISLLYETFLARQERLVPRNHTALAQAKYKVGCVRALRAEQQNGPQRRALRSEAKALLTEALDHQQVFLDRSDLQLARTRLALAQLLACEVDFDGAKAMCDLALSDLLSTRPDDHPDLVEVYLETVAPSYTGPNARSHCRTLVEKALAIAEKTDRRDLFHANACAMMASFLPHSAVEERRKWLQKALEISRETLPPEHPQIKFYEGKLNTALQKPSPAKQEF